MIFDRMQIEFISDETTSNLFQLNARITELVEKRGTTSMKILIAIR